MRLSPETLKEITISLFFNAFAKSLKKLSSLLDNLMIYCTHKQTTPSNTYIQYRLILQLPFLEFRSVK